MSELNVSKEEKKKGEKILNDYVNREAIAVLIHKPTNKSTSHLNIKIKDIRSWAERSIEALNKLRERESEEKYPVEDFVLVEIRPGNVVRVTSLE